MVRQRLVSHRAYIVYYYELHGLKEEVKISYVPLVHKNQTDVWLIRNELELIWKCFIPSEQVDFRGRNTLISIQ